MTHLTSALNYFFSLSPLLSINEGEEIWISTDTEIVKTWKVIGDLKPYTKYEVKLVAMNKFGVTVNSKVVTIETNPTKGKNHNGMSPWSFLVVQNQSIFEGLFYLSANVYCVPNGPVAVLLVWVLESVI